MSYADHKVPNANVLGGDEGIGHGQQYALSALELGRINIAARAVGGAPKAAFEAAMRYAQQRETFGRPIYDHKGDPVQVGRDGHQTAGGQAHDLRRGQAGRLG
ncbi:MAG: hypothetical protein CM1200mP26_24980 [Acidimicrobiales bacterium]|nr:MAG: hypothetical protein CM1200mP26_24980 [Acidimicrobiales bacterium]